MHAVTHTTPLKSCPLGLGCSTSAAFDTQAVSGIAYFLQVSWEEVFLLRTGLWPACLGGYNAFGRGIPGRYLGIRAVFKATG